MFARTMLSDLNKVAESLTGLKMTKKKAANVQIKQEEWDYSLNTFTLVVVVGSVPVVPVVRTGFYIYLFYLYFKFI